MTVSRDPVALPQGIRHGTHKAYSTYKCRCLECFTFRSQYDRGRYAEREGAARRDPEYRIQLAENAAQRKEDAQAARRAPYMRTVWELLLESAPSGPDDAVFALRYAVSEQTYVGVNLRNATERMAVKEFARRFGGRPVKRATWTQKRIHQDELEEA